MFLMRSRDTRFNRNKLSFGIPPSVKSWMQETALDAMGENKASYMMKAGIDQLPEADQDVSYLEVVCLDAKLATY